MSVRVLNQAVYSLIKSQRCEQIGRVKGEVRCKCEYEHGNMPKGCSCDRM